MDPDNISIFQSKSQIPKAIKESILRIKFSLYLSLFIKALLPTVYSSVRISLLGDLPSAAGVDIASQVVWLSLFFEVFQEMLIMPLCYTFGNTIDDLSVTSNKIKTGSLIIISVFSIIAVILYFLMPILVEAMGQNKDLVQETVNYTRQRYELYKNDLKLKVLSQDRSFWFYFLQCEQVLAHSHRAFVDEQSYCGKSCP